MIFIIKWPKFPGHFLAEKGTLQFFYKKWLGQHFGPFLSQAHLVTLQSTKLLAQASHFFHDNDPR
jgi:hypothetical protein